MGLFALVEPQMVAVNRVLETTLRHSNALVAQVSQYLLATSGKRLRPALVLLAGQLGPEPNQPDERLEQVAAAVEMIHMATLVHDDILDDADMRRGQLAVRKRYSDGIAVLTGDYLFARAFQLFAATGDSAIVDLAANVVHVMCTGEIAQNLATHQVVSESEYRRRIAAKTAYFLEASCRMGAMATAAEPAVVEAIGQYGHHIGMAFQMVDDLLDWLADPHHLGKAVGGDIAAGVYTLPVIFGLDQMAVRLQLEEMLKAVEPLAFLGQIRELLRECGALDYTREAASREIDRALSAVAGLGPSSARTAFIELAQFILAREY